MERFGNSVGAVPQAGENCQSNEVLVIEVLPYRLKSDFVFFGRLVGDSFRPRDDGFFLFVEKATFSPAISLEEIDMFIGIPKGSTELLVVPDSVIAGVDVTSFQDG